MKAVFIVYNQALTEQIIETLNNLEIRGFTKFDNLQGRGSNEGDPHMGNHTWPALNNGTLIVVEDEKVDGVLRHLKEINEEAPEEGLRSFVWNVEKIL